MSYGARPSRWDIRLRRVFEKIAVGLRRIAATRTGRAAAELGKALSADVTDLTEIVVHRVRNALSVIDWRWEEGSRAAARFHNIAKRTRLRYGLGFGLFLALASLGGTLAWMLHDLPFAEVLKGGSERIILLEAANGQALARKGPFRASDKSLEELPPHLIDAVISIEDRRFYTHNGLDPWALLRALGRNLRAGEVVEGGSTITQQLVKILYLDKGRTLIRKIREAALALWLESELSKEES
jgi:membrane peptidoglycan carboxypeptidase